MKLHSLLLIILIIFSSCKEKNTESQDVQEDPINSASNSYPENLNMVFEAHGGLDLWKQMQTLKFTIPEDQGIEVTTVALKSRKSLIDMPNHRIGFDGSEVWLHKKDTMAYKGDPKFYYNLMFYFYAMPFVLADDGIKYKDVEALSFEGKTYPGIKISYESGVGESPEDEYILYYDTMTHHMIGLSYTVTYFSKEKSKDFHFIKYSSWQTVNGLLLPKVLEWYHVENNLPTTKRNEVIFTDVSITKEKMPSETFAKPGGAELIE